VLGELLFGGALGRCAADALAAMAACAGMKTGNRLRDGAVLENVMPVHQTVDVLMSHG